MEFFNKIRGFFAEVVAELKKSAWPTRKELIDSTMVVIITVLVMGVFVALADVIFVRLIGWLTKST
jgi:preprotein translocase subunit SecE